MLDTGSGLPALQAEVASSLAEIVKKISNIEDRNKKIIKQLRNLKREMTQENGKDCQNLPLVQEIANEQVWKEESNVSTFLFYILKSILFGSAK